MDYVKFNEWEKFRWHYDARINRLCVTIVTNVGEARGATLLSKENLRPEALSVNYFTRDDKEHYEEFMQRLSDFPFSYDDKCLIAYNAVATRRFHRIMAPVNGLYVDCGEGKAARAPDVGEVVVAVPRYLGADGRHTEDDFIVVEVDRKEKNCYLMKIKKEPTVIGIGVENREVFLKPGACVRLSFDHIVRISALNCSLIKTLNIA